MTRCIRWSVREGEALPLPPFNSSNHLSLEGVGGVVYNMFGHFCIDSIDLFLFLTAAADEVFVICPD